MSVNNSVILIGMPGAGKSTLGILLAKELALGFLDTDVAIQEKVNKTLQAVLDEQGYMALRAVEEEVVLGTECHGKVIATGGSVVYSDKAMAYLKSCGKVIFLSVPLEELRRRIHNYETRGIARKPEQSFEELFAERKALYTRYADITIECASASAGEIVQQLTERLSI